MVRCRFIQGPSQNNFLFLENISRNFSRYLDSYENITLLGDFNMTAEDKNLQDFTDTFSLEHLINEQNCFKGSPGCTDLIITNRKPNFKNTCVTVTGISHYHKFTAVTWKSQILKAPPKIKAYTDTLNHDLLIAKVEAFTVSPKILLITFKVIYAIVYKEQMLIIIF